MGAFSAEFIDVSAIGLNGSLTPEVVGFQRRNANVLATHLTDMFNRPAERFVLYFPPGRYLIGRPTMSMPGEQHPDILVPANVTLKFASGAQLVPMGYANEAGDALFGPAPTGPEGDWRQRTLDGLQHSESFKVRIEIQGRVEAGIFPIFDALAHEGLDTSIVQEAGRILFQRDAIRAIYPEWWNAVPLVNEEVPNAARVRRTTVALQMALDAAHNRRVSSWRAPGAAVHSSIPVVLVNDYAIDRPLRIGATFNQASGQEPIHDDPAREAPANRNGLLIRGECGPATRRFGAALIKAAPNFVPPTDPSAPVGPDPRRPTRTEVDSMLVLRTSTGVTVRNVVFDANESAERCATLASPAVDNRRFDADGTPRDPVFEPSHHNGFEGCEFRNALRALVHVGGEFPPLPDSLNDNPMPNTQGVESVTVDNLAFTGTQDISGLRFTRCRFVTGATESIAAAIARPSPVMPLPITELRADYDDSLARYWRVGVMHRAKESLLTEFHGCAFVGPASPMMLLLGGRVSLQGCSFRTETIGSGNGPSATLADQTLRQWDGTDILLPIALRERYVGPGLLPVGMTSITARHVDSRSRQFLSTYSNDIRAGLGHPVYSSVLLIHLRHRSDFRTVEASNPARPAIYWGGARRFNVVLTLLGCVFGERERDESIRGAVYVAADGDTIAPVVDLGSRRLDGDELLVNPNLLLIQGVLRLGSTTDSPMRR